jgi:DNA replication protein DnaC
MAQATETAPAKVEDFEQAATVLQRESVRKRLKLLQESADESWAQENLNCKICRDVGMIVVPDKGAKLCECRLERERKRKLTLMPAEYRKGAISLATMTPMPELHPKQAEYIELMRSDPLGKYVISGDFGTGKTHFFWALYLEAVRADRKIYAGTLRALIDEYQRGIEASQNQEAYILPIYADDFRQDAIKYSLFIDDIDKARPTEYVAEKLFDLVDAAYSFEHQIVVTTNLRIDQLVHHFRRADKEFGRYGGAIIRRLLDGAHEIEMF